MPASHAASSGSPVTLTLGNENMPYFFICPIYLLLVLCLGTISIAAFFTPRFRHLSLPIAIGTIGTFPGLIIANVLFWVCFIGIAFILKQPFAQVEGALQTGKAIGLAILFVIGLAAANLGGCVLGFISGLWLRQKIKKHA